MTDNEMKNKVVESVKQFINKYNKSFSKKAYDIPIKFTKRGKCAGCVSYHGDNVEFNFNMVLLRENFEDFLLNTVPHEVAHFVTWIQYGHQYTKSGRRIIHGKDWKNMMSFFNVKDNRCHSYNTEKSSIRKMKRFTYKCGCMTHELTAIRHNKILKGTSKYCCSRCKQKLERV
jgi:SprT protein